MPLSIAAGWRCTAASKLGRNMTTRQNLPGKVWDPPQAFGERQAPWLPQRLVFSDVTGPSAQERR
jgi:hypothetical protein